ncbi:MAG: transpeptidase family protein [Prevotellaceae bacterium]|nr:transpeptidase family protein [Prevotellaceae bacterium]
MKFDKKYISRKFPIVVSIAIVMCGFIFYYMLKTMTVEHDYWIEQNKEINKQTRKIKSAQRGNILSTNGDLMASSLPNYKAYFDFMAGVPKDSRNKKAHVLYDSLYRVRKELLLSRMDSIAEGLAVICPAYDRSGKPTRDKKYYKEYLMKGWEEAERVEKIKSDKIQRGDTTWTSARLPYRHYDLCDGYLLNFLQYNQLKKLPVLCFKSRNRSGLIPEERNNRKKPFGLLANKVLGSLYGSNAQKAEGKDGETNDSITAIYGLELAYDSVLRGRDGVSLLRRVRSHNVEIVEREPMNGDDLVSTIDVTLQDVCESALRKKLIDTDAEFGVVILLETHTGDVKAMVNLERDPFNETNYVERSDYAMGAAMEPGSTFKTASIMVALDDGVISINDKIDTGNGAWPMYGRWMKDSGGRGHGVIDVTHAMIYSSNIGVSRLIDSKYHDNPDKFIEGLKRVGIGTPLGIPMRGLRDPQILGPKENKHWAATSIPWMSIGYGSMVAPMQTVTFYNAIANNGRMVRPRFARAISRGGNIVEEFPVEVIKEQICKPQTLKEIQGILKAVVNDERGTGKRARSKYFSVSGKTGTAQVLYKGNYKTGMHFVTFCGYFPSDAPKYTCLVSVQTRAGGVSGGGICGPVFAQIADRVYSKVVTADVATARDSLSIMVPNVKAGDGLAAQKVLNRLGVSYSGAVQSASLATAEIRGEGVDFTSVESNLETMPNLTGLGARDAVYAIESRGMKARLSGVGKVRSQSMAAGSKVVKGTVVRVELN